jgi:hypothetical protein
MFQVGISLFIKRFPKKTGAIKRLSVFFYLILCTHLYSTAQTYTPNLFSLIPNDNIFQKYGNDTIGNGLIYGKHYGKGEFYASCNNGTYI